MVRWPSLWCQNIAPSFEDFATFALSFQTLTLKIYKLFSPRVSATTIPWKLFGDVNVLDVNVIARSKATKEHVFKDKMSRKKNSVAD
jgi:hypothetical protein